MADQLESCSEMPPPGGPCDTVHFARRASKKARRKLGHSNPGFIGIYGLFAVAAVLATLVWRISRWFGVGNALAVGVFAVLAAAILLWTVVATYRCRRAAARAQNALTDDTRRLNCVGHQQHILQHGRLEDVPFEPAVFSATFSYKWSPSMFLTFFLLLPPLASPPWPPDVCGRLIFVWCPAVSTSCATTPSLAKRCSSNTSIFA